MRSYYVYRPNKHHHGVTGSCCYDCDYQRKVEETTFGEIKKEKRKLKFKKGLFKIGALGIIATSSLVACASGTAIEAKRTNVPFGEVPFSSVVTEDQHVIVHGTDEYAIMGAVVGLLISSLCFSNSKYIDLSNREEKIYKLEKDKKEFEKSKKLVKRLD